MSVFVFKRICSLLCFPVDPSINTSVLASDLLTHFGLPLWNSCIYSQEPVQENYSISWVLCVFSQSVSKYGRPGLWLADAFFTSSFPSLHGFQQNFIGSKYSTSCTKFLLHLDDLPTNMPLWPLIGWSFSTFPLQLLHGFQWNFQFNQATTNYWQCGKHYCQHILMHLWAFYALSGFLFFLLPNSFYLFVGLGSFFQLSALCFSLSLHPPPSRPAGRHAEGPSSVGGASPVRRHSRSGGPSLPRPGVLSSLTNKV